MPWPRALLAGHLAAAALAGCTDADPTARRPEGAGSASSAIVGGHDVTSATPVIELGVGGVCTGTLLAPNLVLTAKHCAADVVGADFECDENGNTVLDPDAGIVVLGPDGAPPGAFGATHAPGAFAIGPYGTSPYAPHVAEVLVSPGTTLCASDMALLVLDRAFDDPTMAPVRLDGPPALGESLTAIGWGYTTGQEYATVLQERPVTAVAIGPQGATPLEGGLSRGAVPVGFFEVGESVCYGDSGGPALAATGAVVGVTSGIDNPAITLGSGTASDCVGPTVRGVYGATAAQKDWLYAGFAAAGATPWLEGQPDPRAGLGDTGAACASDADCKSNVCVPAEDGGSQCSHGCLAAPCSAGYSCATLANDLRCVPAGGADDAGATSAAPSGLSPSGGCAASRAPAGGWPWMLGGMGLLGLLALARRR